MPRIGAQQTPQRNLPKMRCGALALASLVGLYSSSVHGQPWLDRPLPSGFEAARSVLIVGRDEPLFAAPAANATRRGAAALGARLPIFAARRGGGCDGAWLMVGSLAWVCSSRVEPSPWPAPPPTPIHPPADGLPYRYHFVGPNGALGYRDFAGAETGVPDAEFEPGFVVALARIRERYPGESFGLTTKGVWVPMRDLGPAHSATLQGVELSGTLNIGWVHVDSAHLYRKPGGARSTEEAAPFTTFTILETLERGGHRWYRTGAESWLRDDDVRVPTTPNPWPQVAPNERWIDVDRGQQVLTAYEGHVPVFATLVSTGRGAEGTEQVTPAGDHRIWIKLRTSDMDNLENTEADRLYAIQDVPWVMYFDRGFGLHGTFWHRSFGRVRSHGCVNLTPLDAWRLFTWTGPRLPAGWSAVLPTPYDRGTLVHVR